MGSKEADLEWKDFFGSSVSLAPSLISIYDKKIKDDGQSCHADPRKRPSSIRSNDSASSKPSKKKITPSVRCPPYRGFSADGEDFTPVVERVANRKGDAKRSKSVENCSRLKRPQALNALLVCKEILETEKFYVRDLKEIIEGYKMAMEAEPSLFHPESVSVLFGNMEEIYSFHCRLLKKLLLREKDVSLLSDCFVNNVDNFKIYSHYCTNYPRSQDVVMAIVDDEMTASWLRDRQTSLNHKLPLSSYLLKPVQRILKYHLLFQNLLKSFDTCEDKKGVEKVSDALDHMSSVASYINEMKRIHDKNTKMKEILDLLVACNPNLNLSGFGEFILEDKFQFGPKTLQHLLLFEKQILIGKWKDGCNLFVKVQIPCSNLMLVETISRSPLSFSIHPFTDSSFLFTIQAKNPEQKCLWCHEIRKAILANFGAHIPDKARNIVMNLTPEVAVPHSIDGKGYGQIEWKKNSRRCSMAIVSDIGQLGKNIEMCNSLDSYSSLQGKHLPFSQSLFSIIDEPMGGSIPFSTSSSTLATHQDVWSHDNVSAYKSFGTLDRSYTASKKAHKGRTSLPLFKRNSSADDSLLERCTDYAAGTRERSDIEAQQSPEKPWSSNKSNIPKRAGSFHNSLIHSISPKPSFRSTFMNLKDKLRRRSHSTDNHHYTSTLKLQEASEEGSKRGPSQRLVTRFAISNKKSKSIVDEKLTSNETVSDRSCDHPKLSNGYKTNSLARKAAGCNKKCFSPPTSTQILFIDDSDDG